jgi:hypothetical protein
MGSLVVVSFLRPPHRTSFRHRHFVLSVNVSYRSISFLVLFAQLHIQQHVFLAHLFIGTQHAVAGNLELTDLSHIGPQ